MGRSKIGRGVLAFGAVGLLWAAELASLLRVSCFDHDDALSLFALPILMPCAMAFVGGVVAHLAMRPSRVERAVAIAVLVPTTGLFVGMIAGLVWWPEEIGEATADGLAFGAAALVLVVPLAMALGRGARAKSLVDDADRLALWARAGAVAAVASVLTLPQWKSYPSCESEPAQAVIATVVAALVAGTAAVTLIAHVLTSRRLLATPPAYLDIGVGEGHVEIGAPRETAYRHPAATASVVHGDAAAGSAALRAHAIGAMLCAIVAVACAMIGIALRVNAS
ncbi:MAG TPA: hypothetical protein VGH28_07475 [Polyangiaceae bacterium]|jgi:hypothetical protein